MKEGNIPFYRFRYKGKVLVHDDYKMLTDHLEIKWNQVLSTGLEKISVVTKDTIICKEAYREQIEKSYKAHGALELCP